MLRALLPCLILALVTRPLAAQRPTPPTLIGGPVPSLLFAGRAAPDARVILDTTTRAIRPTHWKRGLAIGGVVGGLGLGGFVYALCKGLSETRTSCLGPALGGLALGAVTGGVVGALTGGQFERKAKGTLAPPRPSS